MRPSTQLKKPASGNPAIDPSVGTRRSRSARASRVAPATGSGTKRNPAGVATRDQAENKSKDQQSVIDISVIAGLRELQEPGEPDAAVELIDLFLRDTPVKIQSLQSAIARSDGPSLKEAAHGLKGSASNLGAHRLSRLCADLEKLAAAGQLAEAAERFGQVTDEFGRVCFVLEQEKQKQINSA